MSITLDGLTQLTTNPAPDFEPAVSPDGTEIAFYSYRSGNRNIWTMPVTGGPPRPLNSHQSEDLSPAWSPDGQQIAIGSNRDDGNWRIWVISGNEGETKQVTFEAGTQVVPLWFPDGKRLAFISYYPDDRDSQLWSVRLADGHLEPLSKPIGWRISPALIWSSDRMHIYFSYSDNIWSLSIQDGTMRQLTDLAGRTGRPGGDALAANDSYLYFVWEEEFGDIWVMDVEIDK